MKQEVPQQAVTGRLAQLSLAPYRKPETPLWIRLHAAFGRAVAGLVERLERDRHREARRC